MIIGIMSDTHGRHEVAALALRALLEAGAEYLIHCGDVGDDEEMLDRLAVLPAAFVWGNNDWERESLSRYAAQIGLTCGDDLCNLTLDGKVIAVTHGDDSALVRKLLDEQTLDYLFTGHTHHPHDTLVGRTRWVNPGALHRAKPKTAATLNLATGELRSLTIAS